MVTSRQRKELQRRMRKVKDAIDDDSKGEDEVEKRAGDVYQYLFDEGLVSGNE